jgi:hypothetical protein
MWEKFKMEVFYTSFYNERDGFTTLDNILYGGAVINAIIGICSTVLFFAATSTSDVPKMVFGIISAVMIIYYLFFGLTCHSMDKIKNLTPRYLRRRSTKYEDLDSKIQEEICLASFYVIGAIFCSSWTYLIYSWKVLYLIIKYIIAGPFYILPRYLIHKSFNKKRLNKCNRKERKDIITSYDDLLDD